MFLKQRFPKKNIIILEKGIFPQGASTKNAGFACFGSISEILNDLDSHDSSSSNIHYIWVVIINSYARYSYLW